jgi:hypothetical protein
MSMDGPIAELPRVRRTLRVARLRTERALRTPFAAPHPAPVFLMANQKCGSSAVTALLGRATGCSATIQFSRELKRPWYAEVKAGRVPFERFVRRNRLALSTPIVKENHLTTFQPELREAFPDARFAWIFRDPRSNIRSLLNRLRIPGDLEQLPQERFDSLPLVWQQVLDGSWYGVSGASYVEVLAARWQYLADAYWSTRDAAALVRYEDFVADKLGSTVRLAEAVGLEPVHDIRRWVDVQYQPRGNRTVSAEEFFGPANLARIVGICGEGMQRLGYPVAAVTLPDVISLPDVITLTDAAQRPADAVSESALAGPTT